ncbi:MAG: FAD-binding oxidoreductase [Dehalococcoidia bacterium]
MVPQGARTALTLGRPLSRYDVALDMTDLDHVVEYEPADMTVTVEAGVTLAALQARLAEEGQYLSVDPPPSDEVTIGGLLATARAGSWRGHLPSARDLVLGATVATPEGTLATSGGRVVKNVTGYDLHRMHTGALGALGVIVSASFKVAPLPEATSTLAFRCADLATAERAAFELLDRRLPMRMLTVLDPPTAAGLGFDAAIVILVAFEGVPGAVARAERETRDLARRVRAQLLDVPATMPVDLRRRAAAGDEGEPTIVRLGVAPSDVCAMLARVAVAGFEGWAHLAAGTVLARAFDVDGRTIEELRAHAESVGGFLQVEHAPRALREAMPPPGDVDLMRALKQRFDPSGVLNPGRWAEGV